MYIGVDIGGRSMKIGIVDKEGQILYQDSTDTKVELGYEKVKDSLVKLIDHTIGIALEKRYEIKSIGIGVPGISDPESDYIIYATNLKWKNVPLGKDLKSIYNFPIYIDNDATVAGIAESVSGVTKGYKNSIFVTLGTGVGGGLIINDKVYSGSHNKGSEIGHMIIGENFYDCNCGKNGCLETFASATAIDRYTQKLIDDGFEDEEFMKSLKENENKIDTKLVFDLAKSGNKLAVNSVNRMTDYLAIGLSNLINLLNPDIIAIGGGVSKAGKYLIDELDKKVINYLIFKEGKTSKIKLSKLGNDAGIIGAALMSEYK